MNTKSLINSICFIALGAVIGIYVYSYIAVNPLKEVIFDLQEQIENDISSQDMQTLIYAKAFTQEGSEGAKKLIASNIEKYVVEMSEKNSLKDNEYKLLVSIKEHYKEFCTPLCNQKIEVVINSHGK